MVSRNQTSFTYVGNEMRTLNSNNLSYDLNGNLTNDEIHFTRYDYNWDNKLRSAVIGANSISLKYDPAGNRVFKQSTVSGQTTDRKYIVDVVGDLPVILLEIEPQGNNSFEIKKTYIYANSEILSEYEPQSPQRYYYLHDRLGSVRQMINQNGAVVAMYTYSPFGETIEETIDQQLSTDNYFKFTGQYLDCETGMYYLRARMYSPYLTRFTGRDLIMGKFEEPMTLHKYLYCQNDPINNYDFNGKWPASIHNELIEKIFPVFYWKSVEKGSARTDSILEGNQSSKFAYMHAMRAEDQSVEDAEKSMWGFIKLKLKHADFLMWLGLDDMAYEQAGMALHPIMDSTSPSHEGFQVVSLEGMPAHLAKEATISEKKQKETISKMNKFLNDYWWIEGAK